MPAKTKPEDTMPAKTKPEDTMPANPADLPVPQLRDEDRPATRRELENLCRALGVPLRALEDPGSVNGGAHLVE